MRSHELIAKSAALRHVKDQKGLDYILRQFPARNRQRILDRLKPHLSFEPQLNGDSTLTDSGEEIPSNSASQVPGVTSNA